MGIIYWTDYKLTSILKMFFSLWVLFVVSTAGNLTLGDKTLPICNGKNKLEMSTTVLRLKTVLPMSFDMVILAINLTLCFVLACCPWKTRIVKSSNRRNRYKTKPAKMRKETILTVTVNKEVTERWECQFPHWKEFITSRFILRRLCRQRIY